MKPGAVPAEQSDLRDAESTIIVSSREGSVTALRAEDGAVVWQHTIEPPCITSVVATADLLCVASHVDHRLARNQPAWLTALRVRDGSLLWRHPLARLRGGVNLALAGDLVVTSADMGDESIWAFQLKTGKFQWTYGLSAGLWRRLRWKYRYGATWWERLRTALTGQAGGGWQMGRLVAAWTGTVLVSEPDPPYPPHLSALKARRGTLRWHYHQSYERVLVAGGARIVLTRITPEGVWSGIVLDATSGAVVSTLPLQRGDQIIACADSRVAYVLTPHTQTVYALRLSDGTELWRATDVRSTDPHRGGLVDNQAVVTDGVLCYVQLIPRESAREVIALDAETGQERWNWHSPVDQNHIVGAAYLVGGGKALCLSTSQGVFALRARDGTQLWHALPTTDLALILPVRLPALER